jgi:hypothetical protein
MLDNAHAGTPSRRPRVKIAVFGSDQISGIPTQADPDASEDLMNQIDNGNYAPIDWTQMVTEHVLDAIPSPSFTPMTTNIQTCAPVSK